MGVGATYGTALAVLAVVAATRPSRCQSSELVEADLRKHCGAYCVAVVSDLFDLPSSTFAELRRDVGESDEGFCTLGGIRKALDARGLRVDVLDPDRVERLERVTVGALRVRWRTGDLYHFVVLCPKGDGSCVVYSPPNSVVERPWDRIRHSLGGLLLSIREPGLLGIDDGLAVACSLFVVAGFAILLVRRPRRREPTPC